MEKYYLDHEKANHHHHHHHNNNKSNQVWDCGSTLYDSFELNGFKKQLDSAIACRSISMPHLPDNRAPPPPLLKPPSKQPIVASSKKPSKSLAKLIRSFFRRSKKPNFIGSLFRLKDQSNKDGSSIYVVYDKSGALTTIPELPEIDFGGLSPEIGTLVRRASSERRAPNSIHISCAHQ